MRNLHSLIAILLLTLSTLLSLTASAQTDTITVCPAKHGCMYRKEGKALSMHLLEKQLKPDRAAMKYYNRGQLNYGVAFAFAFSGGAVIGSELGKLMGGKSGANMATVAAGAGLIGAAIPFNIAFVRNTRKAVETYNAGKRGTTANFRRTKWSLACGPTAIGLHLTF
jgi:hypothetical protein